MTNSKSYGATETKTEHKHFKFESRFRYKARLNESKEKVDIAGFHDQLKTREHNSDIKNKVKQKNKLQFVEEKWNMMYKVTKEASRNALDTKKQLEKIQ